MSAKGGKCPDPLADSCERCVTSPEGLIICLDFIIRSPIARPPTDQAIREAATLETLLPLLEACGCMPCISRVDGQWLGEVNEGGEFCGEGDDPFRALKDPALAWLSHDRPLDGLATLGGNP